MKPSIKAALISALVFPGLGHFALKRGARGCLFLLPALCGALLIFRQVLQRASLILDQLDNGSLALDPQAIAERLTAAAGTEGPLLTLAVALCLLCWAGSIIDSFLISRDPVANT